MKNKTGYENLIKEKLKQILWLGVALIYTISMFFVFNSNNKTYAQQVILPTNFVVNSLNDYAVDNDVVFLSWSTVESYSYRYNTAWNVEEFPIRDGVFILYFDYIGSGPENVQTIASNHNLVVDIRSYGGGGVANFTNQERFTPRGNSYSSHFFLASNSHNSFGGYVRFNFSGSTNDLLDYDIKLAFLPVQKSDFYATVYSAWTGQASYDAGYQDGLDDAVDFDDNDFYNQGYEDAKTEYENSGYDVGYEDAKTDYYQPRYDAGYNVGKSAGYQDGLNDSEANPLLSMLIGSFSAIGVILDINILPGISIGMLILIPVLFGIIAFIIGRRGGKD